MREEAKGRSEEKSTARDVEEWKEEGTYLEGIERRKKGNRMGIKQERKRRRQTGKIEEVKERSAYLLC